jgi:signal transduction histidine kinase
MTVSSLRRIWLVDDSPLDAERARRALGDAFEIEVFNDGASVLEELSARKPPDLLILDWVMPGVSGVDVCRFIRGGASYGASLKVLLLTGHDETAQIVEGLDAGADDYLAKPYAEEELRARVAVLVRAQELLERVAQAEQAVRSLLDQAPDALIAVDVLGRLTYVNEEACRALGRHASDLVGQRVTQCIEGFELASDGIPGAALPDVYIGDRIFAPTIRQATALHHTGTTISLRDVTDRRQLEQRKLDFYSIVAHDLRSPLTTILLRTKMMLLGKRGLLPADALSDLRKVERNVRSMVALINDFLDLARMESKSFHLERTDLDIGELLDDAAEELRPLADANNVHLRVVRPLRRVAVYADGARMTQVLANLLGNAVKFTPPGGSVTARLELVDDGVQVTVEDTGAGISAEVQAALFQRFVRGQEVPGTAGTGLGLMIVREIVEAHGGTVGVESAVGQGSSFWVRLSTAGLGSLIPSQPGTTA